MSQHHQQKIPPFSSNSPPPIDLDDLDFHEEPPLDDYQDIEEDFKEGFDTDVVDSELPELPNDFNEFRQHDIPGTCTDVEEALTISNTIHILGIKDEPTKESPISTIPEMNSNLEKSFCNQQKEFIESLSPTIPCDDIPIQQSFGSFISEVDIAVDIVYECVSQSGRNNFEDSDLIIPVDDTVFSNIGHDDDDFNDFKSAPIPDNLTRKVPVFEPQIVQPEAISFEANFASFSETFDDNQDLSSVHTQQTELKIDSKSFNEDNDDDFDDFQDFSVQTTHIFKNVINQETFFEQENVVSVLDMMFPLISLDPEFESFQKNELDQSDIIRNLNDFDTSKALGYQYTSSKSSQTLVKALGIDTRNILHGAQWNSSMPRYAANLSISPLEPLKPSTSSSTHSPKLASKSQHGLPSFSTDAPVPDVQFDWNGSGLVNPLDDGVQEILQQDRGVSATAINTVSTVFETDQGNVPSILDQAPTQVFEETTAKSEVLDDQSTTTDSTYQWQQSEVEEESPKPFIVSGSNLRTIKLPETHIFTPVKGSSPISQEVVSEDLAVPVAVDCTYTKNKIIVKEYHDVEYSLEVPKKQEDEDDTCEFNDFQCVPAVWSQPQTFNEALTNPSILQPHILQESDDKIEIKWPEPGNVLNTENYSDLTHLAHSFLESTVETSLPTEMKNLSIPVNFKSKENFCKPTIGKSPTDDTDDDFSDFQTAPQLTICAASLQQPIVPQSNSVNSFVTVPAFTGQKPVIEPNYTNDPITLSPARLQTINKIDVAKSIWNNCIDDDEISRIEAAFPKCKVAPKKAVLVEEPALEEEWSDFVSLPNEQSSVYTSMQNQINSSQIAFTNNTRPASQSIADDYWSDFVSVRPNFSSWNQPSIAPSLPAFGSYSNDVTLSTDNNKVPTSNNFVNITNNFNYNVAPNHHLRQFSNSYQSQQRPDKTLVKQQRNEIPNISILPGLSFSKTRPSSNATKK